MEFTLREIGAVIGVPAESDARITGWSVDTRSVAAGDLFFALRGPNHDGNAYVDQAIRKGAVAAIAGREGVQPHAGAGIHQDAGPILVVPDTLVALQTIARWARDQWGGEVVGVTGSAGKTSTKDVIAAMLAVELPAGKTVGNFNNHVGVPLSILRLARGARVAVLEMGMNHAGEIRELCAIARPKVGVVTNVGHAHMEAFDSIEGIAAAKRELIESLPADGVAVLNVDDSRVAKFAEVHPGRTITFGLSERADVRATDVEIGEDGVKFSVDGLRFESALLGRHSVSNFLAGIAVCSLYGIATARLTDVVREMPAGSMRGQTIRHNGILILNDCYNSNPDAARTMIDVLRDTPAKRRIAVLGEMLELGRWAEPLHREVGRYVADSGINVLVGIRGAASALVDEAKRAGQAANAAFFFDEAAAAGDYLRQIAQEGDVILFKGSRGTHVEQALERFLAQPS